MNDRLVVKEKKKKLPTAANVLVFSGGDGETDGGEEGY